jgi:hypothetical protein
MKKYIFILILFIPTISFSQEITQSLISKRAVGRLYQGAFTRVTSSIYNEVSQRTVKVYKDELLTKAITPEDFAKIGNYKEKRKWPVEQNGTTIEIDTLLEIPMTWEWVWGLKKVTPGIFAIYIQKPKDAAIRKGELVAYIDAADLKKMIGDFEWSMVNALTLDGKIANKSTITDVYWGKYLKFRGELWNAVMNKKLNAYNTPTFINKYEIATLKDLFRTERYINVVPDSLHREQDYQKTEYDPFVVDSLQGIGLAIKLKNDMNGSATFQLNGVAALYDASHMGGENVFVDPMYWMKWEEFNKLLKPEDLQFIHEVMFLAISERLNCDCNF